MKITLAFVVLCSLIIGFATPALSQQDDCDDYCDAADLACQSAWHQLHTQRHYDECSNSDGIVSLEGYCQIAWVYSVQLNFGWTRVDCQGSFCRVEGEIKCGGSRKPYEIECTSEGDSYTPEATGFRTGARCISNDYGISVSCNSTTGNLVYSLFAP